MSTNIKEHIAYIFLKEFLWCQVLHLSLWSTFWVYFLYMVFLYILLAYCIYASKFGKLSSGHRVGKGQFSFQSQRKAMPKDAQVQFNHSVMSDSLWPRGLQHTRPPCSSSIHRVYSNSYPLSWWCHPTISCSVISFYSHFQSFPASGSFQMSQFFKSGGQSIGVSASASVLPMNIQDWFPLGWTGWISLLSKGLSRVFSNTTVQKHQFFSAQLSL